MFANEFESHPEEGRTDRGQWDAPVREPLEKKCKTSREYPPSHGDQEQNAPAARHGKATVYRENRGDPRHGGEHKEKPVEKTAAKRHRWPCSQKREEKNSHAEPGVDTQVQARIGK